MLRMTILTIRCLSTRVVLTIRGIFTPMHLPQLDVPWQLRALSNGQCQAMRSIAGFFGEWQRSALPFSRSDTRQPELFLKFAGSVGR